MKPLPIDRTAAKARAVREMAHDFDDKLRAYKGPEWNRAQAAELRRKAGEYVGETGRRSMAPKQGMELLAWAYVWLWIGLAADDERGQAHKWWRETVEGMRGEYRWRQATGEVPVPTPAGPPDEWADECERVVE